MILDDIIAHKQLEVAQRKAEMPADELQAKLVELGVPRNFKSAIKSTVKIKLIAELKRSSPSRGIIREDFEPQEIAKIYENNGAAALSVLTDEQFFQGRREFISQVKQVASLPVLRKDFIIDPYQIYESRYLGADAILLIAAVLLPGQIEEFLQITGDLGMAALVEVHDEEELQKVLPTEAQIIGINNRNLQDFKVDLSTTFRLIDKIPNDKIKVSESGIFKREQVVKLEQAGIDAVLIGEALLVSADIGTKIKELLGR